MTEKFMNPLDTLFDIDPGSRDGGELSEYAQISAPAVATPPAEKDAEDIEVDAKIDAVYDQAMDTFKAQTEMIQIIEPRYSARNAEVAASYLNIALQAATVRARVKGDRKRMSTFIPQGAKVTNNTIVATRDEIMRMISIDGEVKKI